MENIKQLENPDIGIRQAREARKITMKDMPKNHYIPDDVEILDDCPYIKRFYKWAKDNDNQP